MTDLVWVISSSALIIAVLIIRAVFGKRMRAGVRYALWGLVLLRLMIPGTVFSSPVSVKSAVMKTEVGENFEAVKGYTALALTEDGEGKLSIKGWTETENNAPAKNTELPVLSTETPDAANIPSVTEKPPVSAGTTAKDDGLPPEKAVTVIGNVTEERFSRVTRTFKASQIMKIVWLTGMGITGAYIVFVNLKFYVNIRKRRVRLERNHGSCPVYSVEGLTSSCLYLGSVYVTKETAEDENMLRYVLAHEFAHRRHGDALNTLLSDAALILHWYNPLVWTAALISKRDSEIFADAGAIRSLGESERENYGIALIRLSAARSKRQMLGLAATSMTNGRRTLKERISYMSKKTKKHALAAALALALMLFAVGCSFLGGGNNNNSALDTSAPTEAPDDVSVTEGVPAAQTQAPTYETVLVPADNSSISTAEGPRAVLVKNGNLYAIFGDNTDGLFGNVETEEQRYALSESGGSIVFNAITSPQLVETDVKQAVLFCAGTRENYFYPQTMETPFACLLYIKTDGSLWVRGSNPRGMFGDVDTAAGVKLLDGVKKVYRGLSCVFALTESGDYYKWGGSAENGGPVLVAKEVAEGGSGSGSSDNFYLTWDGRLIADNGENSTVIVENVRCFSADEYRVIAVLKDGTAKLFTFGEGSMYSGELVIKEDEHFETGVAYCGIGGSSIFVVREDGTLLSTTNYAWNDMREAMKDTASAYVGGGSIYAVDKNGTLCFVNRLYTVLQDGTLQYINRGEPIAGHVSFVSPMPGSEGCLYVTEDGVLHRYSISDGIFDYAIFTAYEPQDPTSELSASESLEAAWTAAQNIEKVHGIAFDKDGAKVNLHRSQATVCFPCVTYPDEVLWVTVGVDDGRYYADWESVYIEPKEGSHDEVIARIGENSVSEKLEEFKNAVITVTADDVRAYGCTKEIGSDEYKQAAAAVYGEKLAEYYKNSLTEDTPFYCFDVRFVSAEGNAEDDSYTVLIGYRVRDMLPFSYLFDYIPYYYGGSVYPEFDGWLLGWTCITPNLDSDGCFTQNAVLNGAGW